MKPKYILIPSVLLLLVVLLFMAKDLFFTSKPDTKNPYEYDLTKFKEIDPDMVCYEEVMQLKPKTDYLYGIATDANYNLYVAGSGNILIYDVSGNLINTINVNDNAYCITVSETGQIYMGMADHVEIWNTDGDQLQSWNSMGEAAIFTSIAVNDNSVYVADAGNKVVYHYNQDGELQNKIGEKDTENGKLGFIIPSPYFDLLIGRDDELWIVNPGIHQLESYRSNGEMISSWKRTSMQLDGFSGCCNPSHIAMLSDGSFVTSEKGIERVKIHEPTGEFKCVVATPDQFIEGTTDLDLAVDSKDRIYVSDPKKGVVKVYDKVDSK
ncbi:MAG: hypothetical protein GY834_08205 [Bacteroidetes bacterium]|nr:hypothetical protein [Bacteroidota bacterium]